MMITMEYRTLLPEESPDYRRIRLESLKEFPEAFSANYQESLRLEKLSLQDDIEKQGLNKFVMGAFADNNLVGICSFVKREKNTGEICQMYVQKTFQGNNIGLTLVEEIVKEALKRYNHLEIFLEVSAENLKAKDFYIRANFEEVQRIDGSEDILMRFKF